MENERTKVQAKGCIQIGDLLIFAFGSFIMFAKTSDVLTAFAPNNWFGLSPNYYGLSAAILIEGILIWRKVKSWLVPPTNFVEWAMDTLTTLTPFILSVVAQVIDGYLTTGILAGMSDGDKRTVTTVVAVLITVPILFEILKTSVENAPVGIFDSVKSGETGNPFAFLGGMFNRGKRGGGGAVQTNALDVNGLQPPVPAPTNGKSKTKTNANP